METNPYLKHLQVNDLESVVEHAGEVYNQTSVIMERLLEESQNIENLEFINEYINEIITFISCEQCTLKSLSKIMEHDYYTHTHSINVSTYCIYFGHVLGLDSSEIEELGCSGILHDLGKSEINKDIINKQSKLTDEEFLEMKSHPKLGYDLAKNLGITNENILSGIRNHHEKMDGTGYPDKIASPKINKFAKIVAICDVFDALTTKRSYKDAYTTFEAFKIMRSEKYHFDNDLLLKFIKMFLK